MIRPDAAERERVGAAVRQLEGEAHRGPAAAPARERRSKRRAGSWSKWWPRTPPRVGGRDRRLRVLAVEPLADRAPVGVGDRGVGRGHRPDLGVQRRDPPPPVGQPGRSVAEPSPWRPGRASVTSALSSHRPPDDPDADADEEQRPELAPVDAWQVEAERLGREEPQPTTRRMSPRISDTLRPWSAGGGCQAGPAAAWRASRPAAARAAVARPPAAQAATRAASAAVGHRRRRRRGWSRSSGRRSSSGSIGQSAPSMPAPVHRTSRLESGDRRRAGDPPRRGRRRGVANSRDTAEIGVFGGSGFYSLLEDVREVKVDTPYGPPSDSFFLAEVGGRRVAFLPRHGRRHTIPPHQINYRANVWAMRSLGVKAVISPCAAGSLQLARQARRLRRLRPVRRSHERPRRHLLRRADRHPPVVGRDRTTRSCASWPSRPSATTASRSTSAARSWSSRARASRPRASRSGSATRAGRSST